MNLWDNPRQCDAVCYDLVLSDWPRGQNRARIANLANGAPPYSQQEVEDNNINVNVSDLTHTRLLHDARSNYANGFLKSGYYARCKTDAGPVHNRDERSAIVTVEWNKMLKGSIQYFERLRASFGLLVLHGISPAVWEREDDWCPIPIGVEDLLLPGETLLGFRNLPFFVVRRSFTGIELTKLTQKERRDPGWNMPFVNRILDWMHQQATQLRAVNWPDVWSPEKTAERDKSQAGGQLAGDRAPKVDVFDIYAYDDSKDSEGWIRRIIMDAWSEPAIGAAAGGSGWTRKNGVAGQTNDFLFTSKGRKVAKDWSNLLSLSYADLSAVFPARHHSVRSMGWMLYAACHLGNRMRCKFYESVMEALMMLFEVDSQADAQNALKLNLVNRGFIDKTIRPVKAQDRWQVNANLVELGLRDNGMVINENASSWVQNKNYSADSTEKTRFQVMAELNAATSLASAALNQSYQYQGFEFREIFRRSLKPRTNNGDVLRFKAACISRGVPKYMLEDFTAWQLEPERVMGGGNKALEMQIAEWLMSNRAAYDPEPQRQILRRATLAYTDDPALTLNLVPEEPPTVTPSTRAASYIAATLMAGVPVEPLTGENHIEIIETLLEFLTNGISSGVQQGGMIEPKELAGLQAIAQHIGARVQLIAEDEQEKARVKEYTTLLTKAMNHIRGFEQRLQAAAQKQAEAAQQGNGGPDPKDMAKVQGMMMQAQTKAQIAEKAAAQRTAQRQISHDLKLRQQMEQHQANLAAKDLEAASNVRRNRMKSTEE